MAAYTIHDDSDDRRAIKFLESLTATNEALSAVKAVRTPHWARYASWSLFVTSQGGTTPTLDLDLIVPDFSTRAKLAAPTDDNPYTLASITQVTGTGTYHQTIDLGPGVSGIADDVTGSANADARMMTNCILPPWIVYNLRTDDGDGDEDAACLLVVQYRR